jgi:hypothetical protein
VGTTGNYTQEVDELIHSGQLRRKLYSTEKKEIVLLVTANA